MTSAVQDAIALALGEQEKPAPKSPEIEVKTEPKCQPIDIRRTFNGLRVGLPLISAALHSSDEPDEALDKMMASIKLLSNELLEGNIESDDHKRKAGLIRSAILKSVEIAAMNDRLDELNGQTLASLINQALEAPDCSEFKDDCHSPFNIHFVLSTGLVARPFTESEATLKVHLSTLLDITHSAFRQILKHNVDNDKLQVIERSFLPDILTLYRRVVDDELRKKQRENLSETTSPVPIHRMIEKTFNAYLSGVIEAAISNSEVSQ